MSSIALISLMNLSSSLTSLDLSYSRLQGKFPEGMFRRPNLQVLSLDGNTNLSISFPKYNWSSPLKQLSLSSTNSSIDLPHLVKCFQNLNALFLGNCHFTRSDDLLPLSNLTKLTWLDLSFNNFSGQIPWNSLNLERLTFLDLSYNMFVGHLPEICTNNSTKLCFLSNSSNDQLEVSLPLYLESLYLYHNLLNGSISTWLYSLPSLKVLDLSTNQFTGSINEFHSCSLVYLYLDQNRLHGHIPRTLFQNKSSCRTREFPNSLFILDISYNQLQGLVLIPPPSLFFFSMSNNQLTGNIPSQICNASSLLVLDLSNNTLNGSLPPCLGNFSENLLVLDLRNNRLQGMIPIFAKLKSLRILNFNDNQLEGPLPQSLLTCKKLEVLDVGNNKINGSFPNWLESLPELQVLILRSNRFYGPVGDPTARLSFQKLRIMDLSNNDFTGHLPRKYFESLSAMMESHAGEFGYMEVENSYYYTESVMVDMKGVYTKLEKIPKIFVFIDLSRNQFLGEIPNLIGMLKSLHGLNFSHNELSGFIPPSLRNLSNLEWLDLSSNQLVGVIPEQLTDLTSLEFLKLSHNKLVGPIPNGKQFNTFENDSYIGNLGLCGFPLSRTCNNEQEQPPSPTNVQQAEDDGFDWKFVWMGYISGLVIGLSIGYIVRSSGKFDHWFSQWAIRRMWYKLNARLRDSLMVDMKGVYTKLEKIPTFFIFIDLSRNQFLGEIPNLIGRLKSLHGLNFSHNELSGSIPPSLRNLSNLEWLDLSSNQLVGVIPEQLEDLTSLEFLKLSHNKLNDSYIGNSGLCGFPLSKTCNNEQEQPPSPTNVQQAEDDGFDWKFVWMGYISGLVIGLSIGYIVLSSGKFDHWFSQCAEDDSLFDCTTSAAAALPGF
ncbi:hypothetical protein UlMin_003620 [Ulmus minor]